MHKRAALLLILACIALSTAYAGNPKFSAVYIFGDSYCDVGNLFAATGGADPAPPYFNGRFSNNYLWVEHVSNAWKLPPVTPSLLGGNDYAFGGAEVTADVPLGGPNFIPSIPHQVAKYLLDHKGKADPNALYVLEGGGNDIIDAAGSGSPQQLAFQIAVGIAGAELALRHVGARNFLVPNIFDLSLTPVGKGFPAFNTAASIATNKAVRELLTLESLFPGNNITFMDNFDLFNAMLVNDPTHFGFKDVTHGCILTVPACADPDHNFFWDDIHPTTFGHSMLAVSVEALYSH